MVDDYLAVLESFARLLRYDGFFVEEAATGHAALAKLRCQRFDLAVIDWRLTDMTGLDVARSMNQLSVPTPWILVSGYMDFEIARAAGRLGALKTVSPPIDIRAVVAQALAENTRDDWTWPPALALSASMTAAERWAALVLHACEAELDPSTVRAWALAAAACETTIYATCKVVNLHARYTRDFARMLRALRKNGGRVGDLEAHMVVADPRTWDALRDRAAVRGRPPDSVITPAEFVRIQTFIPHENSGLAALRAWIAPRQRN